MLFSTGNEKQLNEKIKQMLSQDSARIPYSMDEYNWDTIAEQVVAVYENVT